MGGAIPGISSSMYLGLILVSLLINLAGVLVALDARERGMSKLVAVLWFFAVIVFFGMPAAVYLFIRNSAMLKKQSPGARTPAAKQDVAPRIRFCPYCGEPHAQDAKICQACRKLL